MFWDKGYTPSQNIEALLNKENVTVEEFLEEDDILQECKSQKNLVNYFTRPDVIRRLVELVTTEPSEDLPLAQRFRHANMACGILTLGLPSLNEKLLSDEDNLRILYSYLENEPPLNPLLSSFYSKTFGMLFTQHLYHDWFLYQKMCLQVIEYLKSRGNFIDLVFKHFATPVIPDLLLNIMHDGEGGTLKKNVYKWLTDEKLVERLITILSDAKESDKHAKVSEFLRELIAQGRFMRQNDPENESFVPTFAGSNPILQVIESEDYVSSLFNMILEPGISESAIISGISVVLTLLKPEAAVEECGSLTGTIVQEREKENHKNTISTVIEVVKSRLDEFIAILRNPPVKPEMLINGSKILPPFGSTRLEICRLFTVLLQTGNKDIAKAICETDFFNTILALFKDYCWNNFLHSEVEKCMQIVFTPVSAANSTTNNNNNNINTETPEDEPPAMTFWNDERETERENSYELQTFVIVNSKIIAKLIDCWMHNNEMQKAENGRRLGYMGHLMKIFKHITACISESEHIGALIESSLSETELEQWQSIIKPNDGEFTMALAVQNRMLADFNPKESVDYSQHLPKEFLNDNFSTEILNDFTATLNNLYINMDEDPMTEIFETEDVYFDAFIDHLLNASETKNQSAMHPFSHWDSGSTSAGGGGGGVDPFNDLSLIGQGETSEGIESNRRPGDWEDFSMDNFADFDSHFVTFSSDMGESLTEKKEAEKLKFPVADGPGVSLSFSSSSSSSTKSDDIKSEFDNNANVEKITKTSIDPFDDDDDNFGSRTKEEGNGQGDTAWVWNKEDETAKNSTVISNGPTTIHDTKDIEELSNQLENTSITESSLPSSTETTKPPLLSTFNEDDDEKKVLDALSENDITAKNSPPSSTNESLCQEQDSSNPTIINQDTKTNSSPAATAAADENTPAL